MEEHMKSLSDQQLWAALDEAFNDCKTAGTAEKDSEWHQACFAAVIAYSAECQKRGLPIRVTH